MSTLAAGAQIRQRCTEKAIPNSERRSLSWSGQSPAGPALDRSLACVVQLRLLVSPSNQSLVPLSSPTAIDPSQTNPPTSSHWSLGPFSLGEN